jgi:hypothetical protein
LVSTTVDRRDVCADQGRRLLVDAPFAAICVAFLEMCERSCRRDWVRLVVAMVVERQVHERVVREPENDVAHVAGLGRRELVEDSFDSTLVLVRRVSGLHRVSRYQSLFHGLLLCESVTR